MSIKMIPHSRPVISNKAIEAVSAVMASGLISQGKVVRQFEEAAAKRTGVQGAVAVNSGTSALHLAILSLGVKAGDEVILPSYLCVAPLNAINYCGATPVLADADPATGNIDPDSVKSAITAKTKAVIVPHLFGTPARINEIKKLGVPVIEDCAQAIGARYNGQEVGSLGDVAIFSFYATKVITCGEGGMVLSNNEKFLSFARDMRDYDEKEIYKPRFNYKMTDMEAALGLIQLQELDQFIAARKKIAAYYSSSFAEIKVKLSIPLPGCEPIFYRYILQIDSHLEDFIANMEQSGIACRRPIFKPLHRILNQKGFPATESIHNKAVSLPIYPGLSQENQGKIITAVKKNLSQL